MSDTDGTCEYVLDPDDPETWGGDEGDECYVDEEVLNENGVWTCPHDAEEGEDLCIFHLPVEEKDDENVVKSMISILDEKSGSSYSTEERCQFFGSRLGKFVCSDDISQGSDLSLIHSTIDEFALYTSEWADRPTIVRRGVNLAGSECNTLMLNCEVNGNIHAQGIKGQDINLQGRFHGQVNFQSARIGGGGLSGEYSHRVDFREANIDGFFALWGNFDATVDFRNTVITDDVSAEGGSKVSGDLRFDCVTFEGEVSFAGLCVGGKGSFEKATIRGDADFRNASLGKASFAKAEFNHGANFCDVDFGESVDMCRTSIDGECRFDRAQVEGDSEFRKFE